MFPISRKMERCEWMNCSHADLLAMNADGNMPYDICDDDPTLDAIEGEMAAQGITQAYIDERRGAAEKVSACI